MSRYKPEFQGAVEGYIVNSISRNYWRVRRLMDREDLFQEAMVVYLKTARAYPALDTPQHFMALFKVAWINRLNDLSKMDTRNRAETVSTESVFLNLKNTVGETDSPGSVSLMVQQAPKEVQTVLSLFLTAPSEILEPTSTSFSRVTTRCRICAFG